VAAQVAAAVVLLVGAGLLLRSVVALASVNPGYDAERILAVHLSMPDARYDAARRAGFLRDADERLRRLPSVMGTGATNVAPFGHMSTANRFRLERSATGGGYLVAAWRSVTPGFFPALGIPLVRGRLFDDRDGADAEQVVIVSRSMAERFWPDIDPIGQRLLWGSSGNPKRIVGIVEDLRDISLSEEPRPTMFRPYPQLTPPDMTLLVRTSRSPRDIAATVRAELHAIDSGVPVRIEPLADALRGSVRHPRVGAAALAAFATLALVLAAAGLYALVAYDVSRQRRETAVRIALGAPPIRVLWTVQRRTLGMVAAGTVAGVGGALAASRALESVLFGIGAEDASTYVAVLLVLGLAALTASTLSGRRALAVDPIELLRSE